MTVHQWIGKSKLNIASHSKGRASPHWTLTLFASYNMSQTYDSYLKNLTEPYKSSLIFLEDEKKLNFLLTRLAMVLNDSSTITEKSRTDLLVDYLDREGGPFKNHLYIGLGQVTYRREGAYYDCNIGQGRDQIGL